MKQRERQSINSWLVAKKGFPSGNPDLKLEHELRDQHPTYTSLRVERTAALIVADHV